MPTTRVPRCPAVGFASSTAPSSVSLAMGLRVPTSGPVISHWRIVQRARLVRGFVRGNASPEVDDERLIRAPAAPRARARRRKVDHIHWRKTMAPRPAEACHFRGTTRAAVAGPSTNRDHHSVPALHTVPQIVLLRAGTNDGYAQASASALANGVERLLDRVERGAPQALIVVAELLPLDDRASRSAAAQ